MKTINNDIRESYCSFEVSKLLKEKGFDCFNEHDLVPIQKPSHALAIEWIEQNFDIVITITTELILYDVEINDYRNSKTVKMISTLAGSTEYSFSTRQEATEAALLYTLTTLLP